ncbi:MAG TPA: divalent metal cation transporter [Streptosporangiaceae bacterium]|nr:divalent metal cation transporter [Streptosporangiaceae bacterium]
MTTELRDTSPAPAPRAERHRWRHLLGILGPGLITGAADDDPSGIATYSQTGAQFGYGQLWTAAWMLPLVTGVQEACGRIGNVTGHGLARNIKNRYSLRTLRLLVTLLAVANVINIGADIGALGASAGLIIHIPATALMIIFTLLILTLEIAVSYRRYAKVLKWLTVSLLAYPITAFFVPEPWGTIARATFVPHIQFSATFFYVITAVIGTTITPYMFFWQTSQEVEENQGRPAKRSLRDLRTDNAVGMIISQAVAWFIIITAATVLHTAHITTINTAADAARALEPLVRTFPHSGEIAQGLFALGIVSLGMLAIPVMAGSTSYALSEARGQKEGLDLKPREGRYFYGVIAASMLIGLALNFTGVNPIKALVFAAVFNGVIAVPLIWFIDRIAADRDTMGQARSGWLSRTILLLTFLGVAGSVVAMAVSYIKG